jgi:predicted HD superfamily hydrolase involved in NAD metabolism
MDLKKMVRVCEKAGLEISDMERNSVSLLHSKAGSILVSEKYGYKDEDIINAVRYHTTGRPGMSLLEKIIFVADYMEPGRDVASDLPEVRYLAFNSDTIDDAVLKILFDSLVYLKSTGREIDPMTQRTYDFYKTHDEVRNYYE